MCLARQNNKQAFCESHLIIRDRVTKYLVGSLQCKCFRRIYITAIIIHQSVLSVKQNTTDGRGEIYKNFYRSKRAVSAFFCQKSRLICCLNYIHTYTVDRRIYLRCSVVIFIVLPGKNWKCDLQKIVVDKCITQHYNIRMSMYSLIIKRCHFKVNV